MSQPRSRLETSLIIATLALLFWLPLPLGSNREWSAALFCLLTALLGAGWAVLQLQKGATPNPALKPALPLFALLLAVQGWVFIQWVSGISTDPGRTLHYLMLGLGYSLLFLLIVGLFYTRKRLTLLASTLVVSATLQGFYGSLMTLSGIEWLFFVPKESYFGVATGTFVNRNHLAGYLVMTLGVGIGLLLALRDGAPLRWTSLLELLVGPKARLRLGLAIMVIALVMTRSRMGNTAFFSSLMILGALFVLLNKEHRLRNGLILASLILIDVLVISQFFGLDKLKDRLINTHVENVIENNQIIARKNELRLDVFDYAWVQFKERPIYGFGAGSFESSFQRYPGPEVPLHYDHAHNDYLQFAIEYGLIGFIPLAGFVLLALYHALRALWRRDSWYRSGMGFGAAMGILGILIHSATDFNLQIPANAATFVTLCAMATLAGRHRKTRRRDV
jgi:O-antigen ligase